MKFFFAIIISLGLSSSLWANCQRSESNFFCAGDWVYTLNGYRGQIEKISPGSTQAHVHWTSTPDGEEINRNVAVSLERLSLGSGCVDGYCVRDLVVGAEGYVGHVVGISPDYNAVTVAWTRDPHGERVFMRRSHLVSLLALSFGCTYGHCVGDTVENSLGRQGEVIAVFRSRGRVAVKWERDQFGRTMYLTEAEGEYHLFSKTLNNQYSEQDRKNAVFPRFDLDQMTHSAFRYSPSRPVK